MLDTEGITYFRDVKKVDWGDSINIEVRSALEESLSVIVIISPASLKSYWVPYEIGYANALRKRILPYVTHPSLDVPPFISDLKYITTIEQAQEYFHAKFVDEKNNTRPPSDNLTDITEMTVPNIPNLSREAQTLLKEASHDPDGIIFRLSTFGGPHIQTNKKKFGGGRDPRTRAIWEGALEELENERLIIDKNYKREVFEVTRKGYEIAELINP
jgi:hypothetical protein